MKKIIALVLVFEMLTTQVILAGAYERNIWSERRKSVSIPARPSETIQLAQLTTGIPLTHPLASSVLPSEPAGLTSSSHPADSALASFISSLSALSVVRETRIGKKGSPTIVYVQDIHGVPEAQKNIGSLI